MRTDLNEERLTELREKVRPYLTEKRYNHTLAVEKEADRLGGIYLPEDRFRLRAAALLHDITKREDYPNQLNYCKLFDIIVPSLSETTPEVFHAITGASLAEKDFSSFVDEDIVSGVRWHTTGHDNMTLFETIIYLADYIEETRTYSGCIELRRELYSRIDNREDPLTVLKESTLKSLNMTVEHLKEKGSVIDQNTMKAIEYFSGNKVFL